MVIFGEDDVEDGVLSILGEFCDGLCFDGFLQGEGEFGADKCDRPSKGAAAGVPFIAILVHPMRGGVLGFTSVIRFGWFSEWGAGLPWHAKNQLMSTTRLYSCRGVSTLKIQSTWVPQRHICKNLIYH